MKPLLLAAAVLTACAAPAPERGVTLQVWGLGREGEVLAEMMPEFERRHPEIRIELQQIPWVAAHEKLLTAVVGQATPDVAQIGNTWLAEFHAIHALAPLGSRIAASQIVRPADYFAGNWAGNVIREETWGLPWYVDTRLLFYRTDLLAEVGFTEPPRTWAEWREALVRLKRRHPFAILLPTDEWEQPVILGLQRGSRLLRAGDRYGDFRGPAFREAFGFYLSLYRDGLAPRTNVNQIANRYISLARGEFAMAISGPWDVGEYRRRLPPEIQDRWSTAPMPSPRNDGRPGTSLAGGSSLVIFRGSRHPEASWKLLEYLSEPAQQLRLFRLCGDLPSRLSAWADPQLAGDPKMRAFFTQLQQVTPTPLLPEWQQIALQIGERAEAAIRGEDPGRTLARLDAEVDQILAKRRSVLARQEAR